MERKAIALIDAGEVPYEAAWAWQRELVAQRAAGEREDTLLLLEHPPTITLGRGAHREHLLVDPHELARRGVALVETDRGGDVTYHAPGQIVGYPILKLSRYGGDVLKYLRDLEEVLIRALATYGLRGERAQQFTGVWVEGAKVAAIGVRVSAGGVTSHGFALNVATDLAGFGQIVPCGIRDRGVISLAALLGAPPPMGEVRERVLEAFADVFRARFMIHLPALASGEEASLKGDLSSSR
jgi:lipoyl(octanoyl) transferase